MGTLRSMTDHGGMIVNGITLGEAARDTDDEGMLIDGSEYRWSDTLLPDGEITSDGEIVVDEMELM
jgi:hypothetical protein